MQGTLPAAGVFLFVIALFAPQLCHALEAHFDWSMPDRFGIVNENGMIDYITTGVDTDGDGLADDYSMSTLAQVYANVQSPHLLIDPGRWQVNFDGCASAPANDIVQYRWYVDGVDQGPGLSCSYSRYFEKEGTHTVRLTVVDGTGNTASVEHVVDVQDWLIVAIGDSYGSGEGNPDQPVPPGDWEHINSLRQDLANLWHDYLVAKETYESVLRTSERILTELLPPWEVAKFVEGNCYALCGFEGLCMYFACKGVREDRERAEDALLAGLGELGLGMGEFIADSVEAAKTIAKAAMDKVYADWDLLNMVIEGKLSDLKAGWQDRRCHRSALSAQARAALAIEKADPRTSVTFLHLSCSGATINEGLLGDYAGVEVPKRPEKIRPQIDQVKDLVGNREIDALLVSIGGNDIKFAPIITSCMIQEPCYMPYAALSIENDLVRTAYCPFVNLLFPGGTELCLLVDVPVVAPPSAGEAFDAAMPQLQGSYARLSDEIAKLQIRPERVFITEYPNATVDEMDLRCGWERLYRTDNTWIPDPLRLMPGITTTELDWADDTVTRRLNSAVADTRTNQMWNVVQGIYSIFRGHGFCANEPWFVRLADSLLTQVDVNGTMHPNSSGHNRIAQKIEDALVAHFYGDGYGRTAPRHPSGSLHGTVSGVGSWAPSGGVVELTRRMGDGSWLFVEQAVTYGQYAFTGLEPGDYRVGVAKEGYVTYQSEVVTVAAGQEIVMPPIVLVALRFQLTVSVNGTGTVTSGPAGINCGSDCSETFSYGTEVMLSVAPATGWRFVGWEGCDSVFVGDTCGVTVQSARSVKAYFVEAASGWTFEKITPPLYGYITSTSVAPGRIAYVAQTGYGDGSTSHARRNVLKEWITSVIEGYPGGSVSLAVNSIHSSLVTYHDMNHHLASAYGFITFPQGGWNWFYDVIDSAGDVGTYSSVAFDSSGKAHVAYYDAANGDLRYATDASGLWAVTVLDNAGDTGRAPSIAVSPGGKVHISYYNGAALRYATNRSGTWSLSTVDFILGGGDLGSYNSIAVDSGGFPHIAYYDATNGNLKYAYWRIFPTQGWSISVIDSTGDVGRYCSLAMDSQGKSHISYFDLTNADLKYATNTSGSWNITALDTAGWVGDFTSIAVDSNDKVHIGYSASDASDFSILKYATNADWTPPSGSLSINGVGVCCTNSTSVTLQLVCNDAETGCARMQFSNDGGATWSDEEDYQTTKAWTIPGGDGVKTVYGRFKSTGGWSGAFSDTIILDTVAPVTTASPPGGVYGAAQSVSFSANEASTIRYTTDGSPPTAGSSVYTSPIALAATATLRFYATDSAGNQEAVKTVLYTIDRSAPTGSVSINDDAVFTNTRNVTLKMTPQDANGVSGMCISNTASCSAWQALKSEMPWTLAEGDGVKTVYAWFRDSVGNANAAPYTDTVTLDTGRPSDGTLSAVAGSGQVALNWQGFTDTLSGVGSYKLLYRTDAAPGTCNDGTQIYTGPDTAYTHMWLTGGATYHYRVCAVDNAGNVSTGAVAAAAVQCLVSTHAGFGGIINPASASVQCGNTLSFTITPRMGYQILTAEGCGGSLGGLRYTTAPVTADCTVSAQFGVNPLVRILRQPPLYTFAIQPACDYAAETDIIQVRALDFTEDLTFDLNKAVMVEGGYDATFGSNPGLTTVRGSVVISLGTVVLENIVIAPPCGVCQSGEQGVCTYALAGTDPNLDCPHGQSCNGAGYCE